MKKFVLEINLGNNAMNTSQEVCDALAIVAIQFPCEDPISEIGVNKIRDANGNTVGFYKVVD